MSLHISIITLLKHFIHIYSLAILIFYYNELYDQSVDKLNFLLYSILHLDKNLNTYFTIK